MAMKIVETGGVMAVLPFVDDASQQVIGFIDRDQNDCIGCWILTLNREMIQPIETRRRTNSIRFAHRARTCHSRRNNF